MIKEIRTLYKSLLSPKYSVIDSKIEDGFITIRFYASEWEGEILYWQGVKWPI